MQLATCDQHKQARSFVSRAAVLVAFLTFAACSAQSPTPPVEETPAPRLVELPRALLPDGAAITLELAMTPEEIATGLMYRPALPGDRGMLFIFAQERVPSFWMKNTLISLDLVFFDSSGIVVDVIAEARPCRAEPCPYYVPDRPARAVLEIAAGQAAALGITEGLKIEFERVPGYPVEEN